MKPLISFLKAFLAFSLLLAAGAPCASAQTVKKHHEEKVPPKTPTQTPKTSKTSKGTKQAVKKQTTKKTAPQIYTKPVEYYFMVNSETSSTTLDKKSNEGGTAWVSVSTNESGGYYITGEPSWCTVVEKQPYGFTLEYTPNPTKQSRSSSFDVVSNSSGDRVRVYVSQEATISEVVFENVRVINDDQLSDGKGMTVEFKMTTKNLGGKNCRAVVYFYDSNGNSLKDTNGRYNSSDGQVCSGEDFKPSSNSSRYTSFNISIPYKEFHLPGSGSKTVKYRIIAWDGNEIVSKTELYTTSFTFNP